jgi:4-alpha-glucanotransferase
VTVASPRAAGILLHPTSLPGPYGIGELGASALRFLDFLQSAGQTLWQVLPLGPTGFGDSPYACFSSFAGNPLLISLDSLMDQGDLSPADVRGVPPFSRQSVDYGSVIQWKMPLLERAARRFLRSRCEGRRAAFDAFRSGEAAWLEDFCLFLALKDEFTRRSANSDAASGGGSGAWNDSWSRDVALREPQALAHWKGRLAEEIEVKEAIQFFFFEQWNVLHAAAAARGIRIIGDLPIFASGDSADVWANRGLFLLDENGMPTAVSGVPPDYFSATGQLWGNPLYDWDALRRQGFRFWIERIRAALRLFDVIRIDHFRGLQACWTVPAGQPTAERGSWAEAPGAEMFEAVERELGDLPVIAEDLGVITPEVNALREKLGFPGMRILQFAFDRAESGVLDGSSRFLPHNHTRDSVIYTGTHDNDTTFGWYESRGSEERDYIERYAASTETDISWRFIRMAFSSVCRFAVIPLQDALGLGSEARMNTPGTTGDNWRWRFTVEALDATLAGRLRTLAVLYGRLRG